VAAGRDDGSDEVRNSARIVNHLRPDARATGLPTPGPPVMTSALQASACRIAAVWLSAKLEALGDPQQRLVGMNPRPGKRARPQRPIGNVAFCPVGSSVRRPVLINPSKEIDQRSRAASPWSRRVASIPATECGPPLEGGLEPFAIEPKGTSLPNVEKV
jgi:hypothetical protein